MKLIKSIILRDHHRQCHQQQHLSHESWKKERKKTLLRPHVNLLFWC